MNYDDVEDFFRELDAEWQQLTPHERLLHEAQSRELGEFVTHQLCEGMIGLSQTFRSYLKRQEDRLRQLKEHLPNDAEQVESEVEIIRKDLCKYIKRLSDVFEDSPVHD